MRKVDFVLLFGFFCLKWKPLSPSFSIPASALQQLEAPNPVLGEAWGPRTLSSQRLGDQNTVLAAAWAPEP